MCQNRDMPLTDLLPVRDVTACCAPITAETLGAEQAIDLASSLKAIADPARLRILSLVAASGSSGVCACDFVEPLALGQPTVSHHLRILVDAGYLAREKRGTWAWYSLVPGSLDGVARLLTTV
jgi:ArsR family transcriptional regulator, arsenate/arsenite/antimonite-responsive transcriptional repressor